MAISECTKKMHFPKDWTLTSTLQLPLQLYTCGATCPKSAITSSTNKSRFALIGAGGMFILKKWGWWLKNTLKYFNNSILQDFLEQQCHLQYSFLYSRGKNMLFQCLWLLSPSPALMKLSFTILRASGSSPWECFPSRIYPELSLWAKPSTKLGESSGSSVRSSSYLKLMLTKRAWSILSMCFLLFEEDGRHQLKLYLEGPSTKKL